MTVSRALRGVEGVSEKKRKEIKKVAEDMNYILNSNARSLVKTSSDLVGISVPTLFNDVFADMLEGMRRTFEKADISTVVNTTNYSKDNEMDWVARLMSWRPAGIVLTGTDHSPNMRRIIQATGIPTVEIWDIVEDPIDICVGVDHFDTGIKLGELAVELGYQRPGYVCSPKGLDYRADRRLAGVQQAFHSAELNVSFATSTQNDRNSFLAGYRGTEILCEQAERPDVIFYVNDHLAFGGYSACRDLGIDVPHDIGLIGFNGLDLNSVLAPKLTTAVTPRRRMGEISAGNLLARINDVKVNRVTALPVELSIGATTRRLGS